MVRLIIGTPSNSLMFLPGILLLPERAGTIATYVLSLGHGRSSSMVIRPSFSRQRKTVFPAWADSSSRNESIPITSRRVRYPRSRPRLGLTGSPCP